MPRKKKSEAVSSPTIHDPRQIDAFPPEQPTASNPFAGKTVAELVAEHQKTKLHVETQSKAFAEFLAPFNEQMKAIKNELNARMLRDGVDSFKTDEGTAYKSVITAHKIDPDAPGYVNHDGNEVHGRDALLDFMLEHWEEYGPYAQIGISKDGVDNAIAKTNKPPPGLILTQLVNINIRKS